MLPSQNKTQSPASRSTGPNKPASQLEHVDLRTQSFVGAAKPCRKTLFKKTTRKTGQGAVGTGTGMESMTATIRRATSIALLASSSVAFSPRWMMSFRLW